MSATLLAWTEAGDYCSTTIREQSFNGQAYIWYLRNPEFSLEYDMWENRHEAREAR